MVGRVTLLTPMAGLPPGRKSLPEVSEFSGPATFWGLGGAAGHMGTWVCPGDGCQKGFCALKELNANTQMAASSKFVIAYR